ncbi:GNAT family N-acetyltransferase [Companilactobacillus nuruki]|uniref:GNAT family N-acetyltransferase n=1 Tax=Companilactobacillus nuruki TaxID=1993540 RepID=A0A2N7AS53_9LACO|nr:GNAT family N-acetyltransferase [Companilactobacillus nuruki]PMD68188.1 GNAT family N-acetyltransferase [Companilactobacillus nuruki]
MRQIKTDRLIIRPIQTQDHDDLQKILLDPEVVRYTRYRNIQTPDNYDLIFRNHFLDTPYTFGIETKEDHKFIGFYEFHPENDTGILTYALSQNTWGKGYVAEVGTAMMTYGFEVLGFNRIEAHYASLNPRSGRVMKKMGMHDLGSISSSVSPHTDKVREVMAYELTKENWFLNNSKEQAV